ncbi:tRNA guanosine(34) transglycosylase Tgt [Alloacidobacterium sp.]|uniref:tRNA guanosine(34) transglycosylase Tgt n=1 Tax=Alloacidobacterium sp. TaxID=2951999 RepID=UPI002D52C104|nr:tRNA guanosine(34) transglycosylase Tgt [Alloacidobacterium sp.]HYK38194.1 tRNA guanosine(34) transglycosylase Tgt [Alloacidobacterium sp.]
MSLTFQVHTTSGNGRRATMTLPHATAETPVFMPVGTVASVKAVPQHLLEELNAQIILGNTYHLYLRPGHELIRRMSGLHRFMSWHRAILTDSGGFQVFSLNELRKVTEEGVQFRSHLDGGLHFFSPEHSMDVQIALGSDIAMAFDECTEYPADYIRARKSLDLTLRWAERSKRHFDAHKNERPWAQGTKSDVQQSLLSPVPCALSPGSMPSLFGIVQGGMYKDLRRESAERLVEMDFPGYALGGLSVGEPRELTREIISETLPYLPKDKPRYVMGVGYPDEIVEYAEMGVDMMDCVLPTRAARHGLLFTSEGRLNIKNRRFAEDQDPPDPACGCMVCRRYSRAYLRHLMASQEPLAAVLNTLHNLAFYLNTMQKLRDRLDSSLNESTRV